MEIAEVFEEMGSLWLRFCELFRQYEYLVGQILL